MKTILQELKDNNLITPPDFVVDNLCLLVHGGSFAYGCSTDSSDFDLFGICIPDQKYLYGHGILGYDDVPVFHEYQQHHIMYKDTEYDIKIYSLPRMFKLASDGNPNMLDILATQDSAVLYENRIGQLVRQNKSMFFSKECVQRFLGFSDNHFKSMENRIKSGNYPENRKHLYEKYGYDTKDATHCIRALYYIKDVLYYGDYRLDKYADVIKLIRNGTYTYENIVELRNELRYEIQRQEYLSSLPKHPDRDLIRARLIYYINLWETCNDV